MEYPKSFCTLLYIYTTEWKKLRLHLTWLQAVLSIFWRTLLYNIWNLTWTKLVLSVYYIDWSLTSICISIAYRMCVWVGVSTIWCTIGFLSNDLHDSRIYVYSDGLCPRRRTFYIIATAIIYSLLFHHIVIQWFFHTRLQFVHEGGFLQLCNSGDNNPANESGY